MRRRIVGPPRHASSAWPGSDFPQKPASMMSRSFPHASTEPHTIGVVSSTTGFRTGPFTSPSSIRYASRPTYFPLNRLSSMFHSMYVFM